MLFNRGLARNSGLSARNLLRFPKTHINFRFENLSTSALRQNAKVITHRKVTSPLEWAQVLEEYGREKEFKDKVEQTKTLILQYKSGEGKRLVALITLASVPTDLRAVARVFNFKDLRFATPDLLAEFASDKDPISVFGFKDLTPELRSKVHILVDDSILKTSSLIALQGHSSNSTWLMSSSDFSAYLAQNDLKYEALSMLNISSSLEKPVRSPKDKGLVEKPRGSKMGLECGKAENFSMWYTQVLVKGEMIEYYSVSGCYIYRPWSYSIWRRITAFFDKAITDMGVEPAYFPMFVSQSVLEKEKDHIEGFAPEVAWVTKAGENDLDVPIAIRPTSETVMYPYFAKWIRSHRDLPLRLNQWNSVVRWEFKDPQPFIRTREFLWQEGHSAFLTQKEADEEVLQVLELYRQVYEDLLAIPIIKGYKSEKEKFAGGCYTTTCEAYVPATGRAIQGATSHSLGQNFSKMFEIAVEDPVDRSNKLHAWQNSWGLSTRSIGVMVMVHGDDKGLVLPPRVADVQVVLVPCGLKASSSDSERLSVEAAIKDAISSLSSVGVRAKADLRDNYTPGFKFNHWELKGVPLRLEVGPREVASNCVVSARRDNGERQTLQLKDLHASIPNLLNSIHNNLFERARVSFKENIFLATRWEQVAPALENKKLILMPWCEQVSCEENIKAATASRNSSPEGQASVAGAKSLCIPFEQPEHSPIIHGETRCLACSHHAKRFALFGRSY
ncbi:hypothetical protein DSO57_1034306 [Entomophthora muscae]|uniref:Uncharacterized protein n=1 Tax=Entomophthora muscae TaxID=34485 RepID=A0ACC2SCV6_9FUNG|nr:hypothetical protein DSO57_1034306 [Entomophthora muscae]